MRTLLLALSALLVVSVSMTRGDQKTFVNYKLLRIQPQTDEHLKYLLDLGSNEDVDIWNDARGIKSLVDIVLSPEAFEKYSQQFVSINLPFEIVQNNLQNIIDEESRSMSRDGRSIIGKFADYANIISYMDDKAEENPTFVSVRNIGMTYEKRQLKTLAIKVKNPKEKIWIDCGIHAREWISPSTCIWMIEEFINDYKKNDPEVVKILNEFEIHFMPLVNPDGYEYTRTSYRLWRKNRAPNKGSSCIGTDLNRNYGFKWMTGGSSNNPCSDTFAGSAADSELETQAMEKEILFQGKWHSYLTIHTYGLWWFLPWGYSTATIPDYDELEDKAQIACAAIKKVSGLDFEIGSSAQLLYVNSGPSDDWARGNASIKYSYTLELRPGQSGPDSNYGFTLPENRAPLAGDETYQGIKAYLKAFLKN